MRQIRAFTRVEILVIGATSGLLGLLGFSVTADTRERSQSFVCMNNLRQIGRGFHAWAAEHGGQHAWWALPADGGYRGTPVGEPLTVPRVGTFPRPVINNAFFHFLWVHEDLPSPDVLVCPADESKRRASDFSTGVGGFAHAGMQNSACSYLVGLDTAGPVPATLLSADRNVITLVGATTCATGITTARNMEGHPPPGWTNGLHQSYGHALKNDGGADRLTSREFSATFRSGDDIGLFHVLLP